MGALAPGCALSERGLRELALPLSWGAPLVCGGENLFQNRGQVGEHLLVREAKHAAAESIQLLCSDLVVLGLLVVNPAIDLDHQPAGRAVEIEDEGTDG